MNSLQNATQSQARSPRTSRLSPELDEFLHMLEALEVQLRPKEAQPVKS